ncbi:MAG: Ppx/GppA family phosphatase [Pedosphaera sp.]|nr:Ppx/GppA family phosphatase [Pedosphaera sp.]
MTRRAVIDVGTNSVKILVADVTGRHVEPVLEKSEQTRLGLGFYKTHLLQAKPIAATATVVATYVNEARRLGAEVIRVIATSAARDAHNRDELIQAIHLKSGVLPVVISGEREAELAFAGVTTDPLLANVPLLLLDVGGGSAEFVVGAGPLQFFRRSFPLGTVRLAEEIQPDDPPTDGQFANAISQLTQYLSSTVKPILDPVLSQVFREEVRLVGTGGTSTILARMKLQSASFDRSRIENVRLTTGEVADMESLLWSLPLAERRRLPGLPVDRADVILGGVSIFCAVMKVFGIAELAMSTRGLRFAAVMDEALDG